MRGRDAQLGGEILNSDWVTEVLFDKCCKGLCESMGGILWTSCASLRAEGLQRAREPNGQKTSVMEDA